MLSTATSPLVQRRRLRTELRRARSDAGLTQEQVARAMDWSLSKIIRIETGAPQNRRRPSAPTEGRPRCLGSHGQGAPRNILLEGRIVKNSQGAIWKA